MNYYVKYLVHSLPTITRPIKKEITFKYYDKWNLDGELLRERIEMYLATFLSPKSFKIIEIIEIEE